MDTLKGQLVMAGGGLLDPNFRQTVILIVEHNDEGALGIVLNRALGVGLVESVPELDHFPNVDPRLYWGGPVSPPNAVVLAEYADPTVAESLVFGPVGLYPAGREPLEAPAVVRTRVYAGYAGWGPNQLEAELATEAWIIEPALIQDVFCTDPDELWRQVLERKGPAFEMFKWMPADPSMN